MPARRALPFMSLILIMLFECVACSQNSPKTVLVIHGGAGVLTNEEMEQAGLTRDAFEKDLARALQAGYDALMSGKAKDKDDANVDAVEAAIRVMEDSELFNAGKGAALTSDGRAELDAAIMEGKMEGNGQGKSDPRKRAGAVAAVTHIRNPISAARAVMEMKGSQHVLLVGEGAEVFAFEPERAATYGIERVSNSYFWTERRLQQVKPPADKAGKPQAAAPRRGGADQRFGTVGAVAVHREKLAAGTSTGGLANKLPGRVGDSPLLGAGTYADDRACGVSCTGTGEVFIRHAVAHDVVARMVYTKAAVAKAVNETINEIPDEPEGVGGLIALDGQGNHAFGMSPKSVGMYRGYVTASGEIFVGIFRNEPEKRINP